MFDNKRFNGWSDYRLKGYIQNLENKHENDLEKSAKKRLESAEKLLFVTGKWIDLQTKCQDMKETLEKIVDPRKRDHKEPDKYTECGCIMNMAQECLERISK